MTLPSPAEPTGPLLWYLSFADESTGLFLGASIVRGWDMADAVAQAHLAGCNPGGEVLGFGLPLGSFEDHWLERLLTREEVREIPPPPGWYG